MAHTNGNTDAKRWEAYALKLLWAFMGVLSILFWDMRRDIIEVRRVQDKHLGLIAQVDMMLRQDQERAIRLALLEKQVSILHDRLRTFEAQ